LARFLYITNTYTRTAVHMSEANNQTLRPVSMADSEKTAARSMGDLEKKEIGVGESALPSAAASVHERSADEKEAQVNEKRHSKASNGDEEDDFEYPTKWKLTIITIALCLSVFCMALVGSVYHLTCDQG
jgi:hypothetical protein